MNVAELIASEPCIEEMLGYRWGCWASGYPLEGEELAKWHKHMDDLRQGHATPGVTKLTRGFRYQRKRKPVRRKFYKADPFWLTDPRLIP